MSWLSRRANERFSADSEALVNTESVEGVAANLTDVSAGGAGLLASVSFDPKQKVEVLIKAGSRIRQDVKKAGEVAWCRKVGYSLWHIGLDLGSDNPINLS
jgi:hypothetical protein